MSTHRSRAIAASAITLLGLGAIAAQPADAQVRSASRDGQLTAPTGTQDGLTCGEPAEVVEAGENWWGTAERDVVVVLPGPGTKVFGSLGDDLIRVHGDAYHYAEIHGGPGEDVIITYSGHSDVFGDEDDDVLIGNGVGDNLQGGAGDDSIKLAHAGSAWGGADDDRLIGSGEDDSLDGGTGDDLIFGFGGADGIHGAAGADELHGGAGFDDLHGGDDTDECHDVASLTDGATFTSCENVAVTFGAGFGGYTS